MLMGIWGVWAFDIFTLIASYLSVDEVSAQTIMRSIGLTTFMVPFGLSLTAGILIGKSVGAKSKKRVLHYYKWCMYFSLIVSFMQIFLLVVFEDFVIGVFTNIDRISTHIHSAWIIF